MKDPIRLLESSPSAFERQMLASVANERVPPELVTRMSAGIGLTLSSAVGVGVAHTLFTEAAGNMGAAASAGAAANAGAAAGAMAGKASIAPTAWTIGGFAASKLTISALSTVTLVAASMAFLADDEPVVRETTVEQVPAPYFEPLAALPQVPMQGTKAMPATQTREQHRKTILNERTTPARQVAPPSLQPVSAGPVGLEVQMLDRARRAISSGQRQQALTLLSTYHAKFPQGVLSNEARLLTAAAEAL